jgi:hypothetical protein
LAKFSICRTFPKYIYPITNILMSFGINITLAIAIERFVMLVDEMLIKATTT